jgi:hypothetical protein
MLQGFYYSQPMRPDQLPYPPGVTEAIEQGREEAA